MDPEGWLVDMRSAHSAPLRNFGWKVNFEVLAK
jgi:hypothetical protein